MAERSDEGVRAALEALVKATQEFHEAATSHLHDSDFELDLFLGKAEAELSVTALPAALAALSTPVPEEGLPRGSASAAEGDVPSSVRTALDAAQVKMGVDSDIWFLDFDLSYPTQSAATAVLQSLRAMAWPTTMAGRKVAPFEVFLILKERLNSGRLGREFLPAAAREIAALSTEAGAGAASALPSPLPSQVEEVADFDRRILEWDIKRDHFACPSGPLAEGKNVYAFLGWEGAHRGTLLLTEEEAEFFQGRLCRLTPNEIVTAEALAAAEARAPQGEPVAWEWRSLLGPAGWGSASLSHTDPGTLNAQYEKRALVPAEALAAERARADNHKADLDETRGDVAEMKWERDEARAETKSETRRADGFASRAFAAEARADRAEEALKPFVEHADAFSHLNEEVVIYGSGGLKITVGNLLRARNILKETPHGER